MKIKNVGKRSVSATGERAYLVDKILFYMWLLVPAYQYSDLHVQQSRVGFWGIAAILMFRMSMRDVYRGRFVVPSRGLMFPFVLVLGWKFIELMRAPGQFNTTLLFFVDFFITYTCYLIIAPRIFSFEAWLVDFRRINVIALGIAIIAHPFIPDRTDMASWNKGESWAFAHPNIAAIYPLVIFLVTLFLFGMKKWRRVNWSNTFCVIFSLSTLVMTGSRTTLAVACVAALLALFNVFILTYFKDDSSGESRVVLSILKICMLVVICGGAYSVYSSMGRATIDSIFSGRLSFAAEVLLSAKDLVLGVGLMPPGANLVVDSTSRGAGIDGLYTNLIYSEGYVGFAIFIIAILAFRRMARVDRRCSAYFNVLLVAGLLFGVTETHFWLLASPLTALIAVLASALGTQAGSYTTVAIGAPMPFLVGKGR